MTVFSRTASQSVSSCSSTGVESSSGSVSFEEPAADDEEAAEVDAEPNAADVVGWTLEPSFSPFCKLNLRFFDGVSSVNTIAMTVLYCTWCTPAHVLSCVLKYVLTHVHAYIYRWTR